MTNLIVGAISIFGLGFALNTLTGFPPLVVVCVCLAAIVCILVLNNRKGKK